MTTYEDSAFEFIPRSKRHTLFSTESALTSRLPRRYVDAYRRSLAQTDEFEAIAVVREWSLRAHLIVDYISGMTDGYALRTYQLVEGLRLEHDD